MPGPTLHLGVRGGRAVRAALCGMVLAELLAVLPAQIRWADAAGLRDADPDDTLLALRALTVSPTFLYGERTGLAAAVYEAVWAALFFGMLLFAARAVARHSAGSSTRPLVFALALVTFAPVADLAAQAARALPRLAFEPVERGMLLHRLLDDAQEQSAHAVVLAVAGVVTLLVSGTWQALREAAAGGSSAEARTTDPGAQDRAEPGPDDPPPPTASPLRQMLLLLRGPEETLWRRIGATLLAVCCAAPFLHLLTSDAVELLLRRPAAALCAYATEPGPCAEMLASAAAAHLPGQENFPHRLVLTYATVYALQGFALSFAGLYFVVRAQRDVRNTPATTLLVVWAAYTTGAVTYAAVLDQAERLVFGHIPTVTDLLIPPSALDHTLLAGPCVGAVFALGTWIRSRIRAARLRNATAPAPESGEGPDAPAVRPGPAGGSAVG